MASNLSPGVYTTELDYSEYTRDTSTCVIGIVGGARRGPVGVPTLVTDTDSMVKTFGKPSEGEYGVYSALIALNNASQVYYTRVVRNGTKASAGTVDTDKVLYSAKNIGEEFNGIKIIQTELDSGKSTFTVTVKDTQDKVLETFADLDLTPSSEHYVETVINTTSNYIRASVQYKGNITAKTFTLGDTLGNKGTNSGSYAHAGKEDTDKILLRSKYYDSDINSCSAIISAQDNFGYFTINIVDTDGNVLESWPSLSMDYKSSRYVETIINKGSDRITCTVNTKEGVDFKEGTLIFSGGDDGIEGITTDDIIGETRGNGLYAFSNPETVSIDVLMAPGWSDMSVISAGIAIAEKRSDCIYIADPPFGMRPQGIIDWSNGSGAYTDHKGLDSSYGALYWPWLKVSDSYTKKDIWMPPSGFVAGQYAYNDNIAHPWYAPAGLTRGKITKAIGVEMSPTQGERDALYGNRNVVNPIVNFISNGIVIWGQKTLQRNPTALDRVNVRRLMCYLERITSNVLRNYVFEQNVDSTWERLMTALTPLYDNVKANGGLYDYKIVMVDDAQDVENNRKNIRVYVKPTKTAEYLDLTFMVEPYSASFDKL